MPAIENIITRMPIEPISFRMCVSLQVSFPGANPRELYTSCCSSAFLEKIVVRNRILGNQGNHRRVYKTFKDTPRCIYPITDLFCVHCGENLRRGATVQTIRAFLG